MVERETPGIPEAMRAESMKITPRGCLSRAFAGIHGGTLIVNLPGSEKPWCRAGGTGTRFGDAALHRLRRLRRRTDSSGKKRSALHGRVAAVAKADASAESCGMYLFHSGVVRKTAKAQAPQNIASAPVSGMLFSYDTAKVDAAIENARKLEGIHYLRVLLNAGEL